MYTRQSPLPFQHPVSFSRQVALYVPTQPKNRNNTVNFTKQNFLSNSLTATRINLINLNKGA